MNTTRVKTASTVRRRIGLAVVTTGMLVVVGGVVFAGIATAQAIAWDAKSDAAAARGLPTDVPTVAPVVPVEPEEAAAAGQDVSSASAVDYSRTPAGWYDATTDPAAIVPSTEAHLSDGVWEAQQQIIARCMAEQGFWYAWTNDRALADPDARVMVLYDHGEAADLAQYGDTPLGDAYDWSRAGCHGYAVHVTGMDDAN